jgi:hypothetical protein
VKTSRWVRRGFIKSFATVLLAGTLPLQGLDEEYFLLFVDGR